MLFLLLSSVSNLLSTQKTTRFPCSTYPKILNSNGLMVSTTGVALSIVFPILAIIAVGGRFYSRRVKDLPIQADDWTILPGLVGLSYSTLKSIADLRQLCAVGIGALGLVGMFESLVLSLQQYSQQRQACTTVMSEHHSRKDPMELPS